MEVCILTMSPTLKLVLVIIAMTVVFVIAFILGIIYRKKVSEREIQSAEEQATRIINDAIKSAESKKTAGGQTVYHRHLKHCPADNQKQLRRHNPLKSKPRNQKKNNVTHDTRNQNCNRIDPRF